MNSLIIDIVHKQANLASKDPYRAFCCSYLGGIKNQQTNLLYQTSRPAAVWWYGGRVEVLDEGSTSGGTDLYWS